jgi:hypothetical protein
MTVKQLRELLDAEGVDENAPVVVEGSDHSYRVARVCFTKADVWAGQRELGEHWDEIEWEEEEAPDKVIDVLYVE